MQMIMEPINSEDDCIRELIRCRERLANACVQSASDVNHQIPLYASSPVPEIALQFARETAKALSKDEFNSLLAFLQDPKGHRKAPKEHLKQQLDARLESFFDQEILVSGLTKARLARPGGPEDADLGLVLHLQSEEDTIGPFWNKESATIELLMKKGFGEKNVFGFDWHWRAEETFRGRSACPTRSWPKALRNIHNNMSCEVLDLLPLPFLVTASSCARDNLAAVLGPECKRLNLTIKPPNGILRVDLDFRSGKLRRMVFHVHHPTSGFFNSHLSRPAMAAQIDAGLDLALWLTGRLSQPNLFAREYALGRPRNSRKAPLSELYAYIRKEREEERILQLDEYEPAFLGWVRKYLRQDPASILFSGVSIGTSVVNQISSRISASLKHRHSQRKSKTVTKTSNTRPRLNSRPDSRFTGSDRANQNKLSQIIPQTNDDSSTCRTRHSHRHGPIKVVTEIFGGSSADGIDKVVEIEDMEETNYSETTEQLEEIDHEEGANEESEFHGEQEHCSESLDHINQTACEVQIPEPMDDQPLEDMPSPCTHADVETSHEFSLDTFHGTEVVVQASGKVKLVGRHGDALFFRMSTKQGQILSKMRKPTITFWPTEIKLQIGDQFVYEKSIERLLSSKQGPQWLAQYHHEMEVSRAQTMIDQECGSSPGLPLTLPSNTANTVGGTLWKNGELQRRLRQGATFKCQPMKNGTEQGRVCVRGVQFLVPPEADFDTVSIQCEVTPEGTQHANQCGTSLEDGDPAQRLGVRLKYTCGGTNEAGQCWATLKGTCNAKKLNSLVDFLDGRDDDWTAEQPRRFLDRYPSKGRTKTTYTS